jgi:hypothetical protein
MEKFTLEQIYRPEPVHAARRIIGELVEVRERIKSSAEGFAILDFVQGFVATELPASMAQNLVDIIRSEVAVERTDQSNELIMLWLENYRRAYSHMIMRVLEEAADPMAL